MRLKKFSDLSLAIRIGLMSAVAIAPAALIFLNGNLADYDWDWFFSHYEAIRVSITDYHQFPWWNPWSAGGVPLYADPQLGIPSIPLVLVLVFGTIWGLQLSVILSMLIGFWGMYLLGNYFGSDARRSALLAFIWVYSGFGIYHLLVGHVSFLQYYIFPIVLYLTLKNTYRFWWVVTGLAWGLYITASPHYIVIQSLLISGLLILSLILTKKYNRKNTLLLFYAATIAILFSLPKIYFAKKYLDSFPRLELNQAVLTGRQLFESFFVPHKIDSLTNTFGWWEIGIYMGVGTILFIIIGMALSIFKRVKQESETYVFLVFSCSCILLAIGPFFKYAPYNLLTKLPIFSSMQVPSRWLGWATFFLILLAATIKFPKKINFNFLLYIAVAEVLLFNIFLQPKPFDYHDSAKRTTVSFQQYSYFDGPVNSAKGTDMYSAIKSGYGEIRAYEPILGYSSDRNTKRCGINEGCEFITNGKILNWSPNSFEVLAVPGEQIKIDMNPSNIFIVDGERKWASNGSAAITQDATVTVPYTGIVVVKAQPRHQWLILIQPTMLILAFGFFAYIKRKEIWSKIRPIY